MAVVAACAGLLAEPERGDPSDIAGHPVLARLGTGGMGTVYLSRTPGRQPAALKVIRREYAKDSAFLARFAREAEASGRVAGRHVVPLLDHDVSGRSSPPWLLHRYVPGVPLATALRRHGPLPTATVRRLLHGTARALAAVHEAGTVHRDVKPGNVLLATDGPWLLDFGIARAAADVTITTAGRLVGTPQYMSPEHALGGRPGPASDVFALGLLAAEAASGRHPFGTGPAFAVAARIAASDTEPPDLMSLPEELRDDVAACLAPEPADRPTAVELAGRTAPRSVVGARDTGRLPPALAATAAALERECRRRVEGPEAPTVRATRRATVPLTLPDGPRPRAPYT
ncbi:serine/threonine-protein kinase [Streptomyces sp. AC512_CC834]|uniref:serine/threonine-protein kinase n=1 Tax=Streptomyces sp. AC512_CC834 TaxID=2823691 RepID=UPI0027E591C8|nr:serine/threonine-protein kinase [Streptomyces sp. AC512_CC834]